MMHIYVAISLERRQKIIQKQNKNIALLLIQNVMEFS